MNREYDQFQRIRLSEQMDRDHKMIEMYRENERFFLERLIDTARELGRLDERLGS